MGKRSVALAIVLTFLTCGIYGIYWLVQIDNDLCEATGDWSGQHGVVLVLLWLFTCGIYSFFWAYSAGGKVDKLDNGGSNAIGFLILNFFGLSIVNFAIAQSKLNQLA